MGKIFLAIILLGMFVPAHAQEKAPPAASQSTESVSESLPNDFLQLADLRATTQSEIANLLQKAKELEALLPEVVENQRRMKELTDAIAVLEKVQKPSPAQEISLANKKVQLGYLQKEQIQKGPPEAIAQRAEAIQQRLKEKTALAAQIQKRITELLSPDHQFKKTMSLVFALLIGAVIIGFFVIAFKDQQIRVAIFSGEAGIQFVTLFSLVIAIILFGITRILEGKELAALLGGLSGYILGRTSSRAAPQQVSTVQGRITHE